VILWLVCANDGRTNQHGMRGRTFDLHDASDLGTKDWSDVI
jgi:hypothetical protein